MLLKLLWMAVCLVSVWFQTGHVMLSIGEKPIVRTNLADLANVDLARAYRGLFVLAIVINSVTVSGVGVDFALAFVMGHSMDFFATLFIMYLSVGVVFQYARLKLKTVNLFEAVSDERIHNFVRSLLGTLASLVVALRCYFGAYSMAMPGLTQQEDMDIRLHLSASTMIFIGLSSLVINVTLRTLVFIERRGHNRSCNDSHLEGRHPPACKYVGLSVTFVAFVIVTFLCYNVPGIREIMVYGMFCIVAPSIAILSNKSTRAFAAKRLIPHWPALTKWPVLAKSSVSPM